MENFAMVEEIDFYMNYYTSHFNFETVEFLQRNIKTAVFWS